VGARGAAGERQWPRGVGVVPADPQLLRARDGACLRGVGCGVWLLVCVGVWVFVWVCGVGVRVGVCVGAVGMRCGCGVRFVCVCVSKM
jgi:hypothetical protein